MPCERSRLKICSVVSFGSSATSQATDSATFVYPGARMASTRGRRRIKGGTRSVASADATIDMRNARAFVPRFWTLIDA